MKLSIKRLLFASLFNNFYLFSVYPSQVVPTDFSTQEDWSAKLLSSDFDSSVPTVWLLEGEDFF